MLKLTGTRRAVRVLAYSPEGLLAAGGDWAPVCVWRPLEAEPAHTLPFCDAVTALAFSPAGILAIGGRAGFLSVMGSKGVPDWVEGQGERFGMAPLIALAFDRTGRAILAAHATRPGEEAPRLLCAEWADLPGAVTLGWPGQLEQATYSPARDAFALAGPHRGVELWEVGRHRNEPFAWLPNRCRGLAFSADGRRLAAACGTCVRVFTLDPPGLLAECRSRKALVRAVAFTPDGRHVLGGCDRMVRMWDAASGKEVAAWDWGVGDIHAVAAALDGMTAAAGGTGGVVVWDVDE